jgi:hypothetical protein
MADIKPKTPEEAGKARQHTAWGQFLEGFDRDTGDFADDRFTALFKDSAFNPDGYQSAFKNSALGPGEKAAYVAGRLAHDVLTDGTRMPYWALNHPLAITGLAGEMASKDAGLAPDYAELRKELQDKGESASRSAIDAEFAKRNGFYHAGEGTGVPLTLARYAIPALATAAMTQFAGNTDYLNLLGGGRTAGFQAVLPVEGDPTQSSNPLLELGARYILGRTGRVLPWEEFHAERPDVSFDDYQRYAAYQFNKGFLDLGLVKGTTRNLDGEAEGTLMGFRVPISAATSAAGALAGGVIGAHHADAVINEQVREKIEALKPVGHRRLAGATIGALLGAIGGKVTGRLANDIVIQPVFNSRALAASEAWQSMSEEERIAIAEGKGSNKSSQGTQLALVQA